MWPEKNFPGYGTRWGALIFGKSGGGRSNFKILWLDHEIPNPIQIFLTKAGSTELGFRTLPESSKNFVGVTPPHLAATALQSAGMAHLAYVVEGHASACPQTVGVGTLCGVVQMTTEERHGKVVCMMIKVEDIKIKTINIFEKKNVIRL